MIDTTQFEGESGAALARRILEDLERRQIGATPKNYELWAAHETGSAPALSKDLRALLGAGVPPPQQALDALYARHIGMEQFSTTILHSSSALSSELAKVLSDIAHIQHHAGEYAEDLRAAEAGAQASAGEDAFRAALVHLTSATKTMMARNEQMQAAMQTSAAQVEALQKSLDAARKEAITDALTGLANRRYFEHCLHEEIEKHAQTLSLIMCDIDHFKRFNDTFGHLVGDSVIRFVAAALRDVRQGVAARYGGEEFALLLAGAGMERAQAIAQQVQQAIKAHKLTRKSTGEQLGTVTLSFGIAQRRSGESAGSFVGRADAALYRSKQSGRDRITCDNALRAA